MDYREISSLPILWGSEGFFVFVFFVKVSLGVLYNREMFPELQSAHSSLIPQFLCLLFFQYKASAIFSCPPSPMVIILPYIFLLTYFFTVFLCC